MAFFVSIAVNAGNDIVAVDFTIEAANEFQAEASAVLAMGQLGFGVGKFEVVSNYDLGQIPDDDASAIEPEDQ